jgi:hypothetical protein
MLGKGKPSKKQSRWQVAIRTLPSNMVNGICNNDDNHDGRQWDSEQEIVQAASTGNMVDVIGHSRWQS